MHYKYISTELFGAFSMGICHKHFQSLFPSFTHSLHCTKVIIKYEIKLGNGAPFNKSILFTLSLNQYTRCYCQLNFVDVVRSCRSVSRARSAFRSFASFNILFMLVNVFCFAPLLAFSCFTIIAA